MRCYLIKYESINKTWYGKVVVLAYNPIEAWNKFIKQWNEDYESGKCDLSSKDIENFSVEFITEDFIEK